MELTHCRSPFFFSLFCLSVSFFIFFFRRLITTSGVSPHPRKQDPIIFYCASIKKSIDLLCNIRSWNRNHLSFEIYNVVGKFLIYTRLKYKSPLDSLEAVSIIFLVSVFPTDNMVDTYRTCVFGFLTLATKYL